LKFIGKGTPEPPPMLSLIINSHKSLSITGKKMKEVRGENNLVPSLVNEDLFGIIKTGSQRD
jgi:hypothetical protein